MSEIQPSRIATARSSRARERTGLHRRACALLLACLLAPSAWASAITSHAPPEPLEPRRVVTLEFLETEIALAVGLPVVAVADKQGYRQWVGAKAQALSGAENIGGRSEPSLERLIRVRPDLVVSSTWRHGGIADRLAQVAPLILYRDLPRPAETDQYTRMRAIVKDLGARTGREIAAERVLRRLDERLARGRKRLAAAGYDGAPVVFGQAVPGNDRLRLFTGNSLAVQVIERLGLTNGWQAPAEDYGYHAVGISDLRQLRADVHLILAADAAAPHFRNLTGNPVWPELPFVRAGHFHRVDSELWPFGGPLSAMRLADRVVQALIGSTKRDEGSG